MSWRNVIRKATELKDDGNVDGAIELLQAALKDAPEQIELMLMLALCLGLNADHEEAIELYEQARAMVPDDKRARIDQSLALEYEITGQPEAALAAAQRALAREPGLYGAALLEAKLTAESGKFAEAIEKFRELRGRSSPAQHAMIDAAIANIQRGMKLRGAPS